MARSFMIYGEDESTRLFELFDPSKMYIETSYDPETHIEFIVNREALMRLFKKTASKEDFEDLKDKIDDMDDYEILENEALCSIVTGNPESTISDTLIAMEIHARERPEILDETVEKWRKSSFGERGEFQDFDGWHAKSIRDEKGKKIHGYIGTLAVWFAADTTIHQFCEDVEVATSSIKKYLIIYRE